MTATTEPLADQLLGALPDARRQMAWIDHLVGFGVRRPGTEENARTVTWCAERLRELGLEVTLQPVRARTSHPGPARVTAWPAGRPDRARVLPGLAMPFTTSVVGGRFRLESISGDTVAADVAVLEHVRFTELPVAWLDGRTLARHDPAGDLDRHVHVLPFGRALGKEIDTIAATGAGAMVGVVDAPWTTSQYFVPYDGVVRPLPAVWIDREQGAELDAMLRDGPVEVELDSPVDHREAVDHNIVAVAPASDAAAAREWIVVGSHHDAPWASAVEDASGIAQVLAQATAWAAIPADRRPVSVAFLLSAAHMSDGAGTREFIASWPHRDRIRFALHLEHVAAEAEPDGAGGLRSTGRPEVRWWFASSPDAAEEQLIVDAVADALAHEDLTRSLVLPADMFGPMPPTDGGFFHLAGVPMVNLLAAPMYLFDPADTPAMIHEPSLEATARAAMRLTLDAAHRWRPRSPGDRR